MSGDVFTEIISSPVTDFILKIGQIVSSSVVAITLWLTVQSYRNMRRTHQIELAHDFFKNHTAFEKESAELKKQQTPIAERTDWASRYFNNLEWFSYLVNSREITDPRLLGFYEPIIIDSYKKIMPKYFDSKQIENEEFLPELKEFYTNLEQGKIDVQRKRFSST